MHFSRDVTIRQKFTSVIDTEDEALNFGEGCAQMAWSFMKGFGQVELETDNDSD
jgi:hypothetical protein